MRITQQMIHQSSVRQTNENLSKLSKTFQQVSTGKLLHKPSDDPHGVSKSMNLKSSISANEQYQRNTNTASLWMDETEQTISGMTNVLHRVRELSVQGSNDTLSTQDRNAIAIELEELTEQIRQFANVKVNGNYLFNGQSTNQPPFPDKNSVLTNTFDSSSKTFKIGDGVIVKGNVTANELFGNVDSDDNLFRTLNNLIEGIRSGEDVSLDQLDKGMERILAVSTEVGARKNRMEAVQNRLLDSNLELRSMLSKIEDVDFAEALTRLSSEESVYQASLSATAKIIQPSLLDFLR